MSYNKNNIKFDVGDTVTITFTSLNDENKCEKIKAYIKCIKEDIQINNEGYPYISFGYIPNDGNWGSFTFARYYFNPNKRPSYKGEIQEVTVIKRLNKNLYYRIGYDKNNFKVILNGIPRDTPTRPSW